MAAVSVSSSPEDSRFYELDILRGIAAFIVVTFHYKHFLLISDTIGFDYDHLPFRSVLMPVYVYGQFFVELFFSISGYVFFWLYGNAIRDRHIGAKSFFIARFARLYPLYFATLIFVAVMQKVFHAHYGSDYIYQQNTPGNFALNLFMVQQWWPNALQTFNGPTWSISVEVFLYLVFFIVCYFRGNRPLILVVLFVMGLGYKYAHFFDNNDFARGMPSFFLGGLVYCSVGFLRETGREIWRRRTVWGLALGLPVLWIVSYAVGSITPPATPPTDLKAWVFSVDSFLYIVLPLSLLGLGLMQDRWKTPLLNRYHLHKASWIGDISYSLYLLHFPLQLVLMLFLAHLPYATRETFFSNPFAFIGFMAVASGLAWLSYRYFEMPVRRVLKLWMTRPLTRRA